MAAWPTITDGVTRLGNALFTSIKAYIDDLVGGQGLPTGGATNDILTKASGTNYDAAWTDAPTLDSLTLDTAAAEATGVAKLYWDATDVTAALGLNANITYHLGAQELVRVSNRTGSAIAAGKVVYIMGAHGDRPEVALADASGESTAATTLGIVAESIADAGQGYVCVSGLLRNLNTDHLTAGGLVWLSETAGETTATRPTQPAHGVFLGLCVKKGPGTSGILYVSVVNGQELDELHDVLISTATAGDLLKRNAGNTLWVNAAPAALTKTDDTNVTLTLGGSASTALVNAASITAGWTGTLASSRLNSNVVQGVTNDTNVTGSIATQTLTLGWTGQLAIARGGTGASTQQAAINALAGAVTSGQYLRGNGTNVIMAAISAGDVPTLNQNTTGSAATLTTARSLWGNSFNGSADLTGAIQLSAGAVGTPALTFSGDLNTGLWAPAADTLAASTGGTERFRLDSSGNIGQGVTPSAWGSGWVAHQVGSGGAFVGRTTNAGIYVTSNLYFDGTDYRYLTTDFASYTRQYQGDHLFYSAASGTAGTVPTFTTLLRLLANGNVAMDATKKLLFDSTAGIGDTYIVESASNTLDLVAGGTTTGRFTSTALTPGANDGAALGTSTVSWADLFLADYGIINWNNGDAQLKHFRLPISVLRIDTAGLTVYPKTTGVGIATYTVGESAERTTYAADASFQLSHYASNTSSYSKTTDLVSNADGTEPSYMRFWTKTLGSSSPAERMRITSTGTVQPGTNDGGALGSGAVSWADLFLASGAVINFNNGDVTVTHSTNTLAFAGAATGYTFADGPITNALGAVGTPSYTFTGDLNTGIWSSAADTLNVSTGGSERMRIDSAGNVGIGMTPGSVKLDILGTTSIRTSNSETNAATKEGRYVFRHYTNAEEDAMFAYVYSTSSDNAIYIGGGSSSQNTATQISFSTAANNTTVSGTERLRITSGGNLAIGATAKLYLDGVAGTGDTYITESSANAISFYAGGSLRMSVDTSYIIQQDANAPGIGFITNASGTSTGTAVVRSSNTVLYLQSSSRRFKENISPANITNAQLDAFLALTPCWWDYTGQKNGALGFIAEDLAALPLERYGYSPLCNFDKDGVVESNRDYALIAMQHLLIQRLERKIAALEARLN